MSNSTCGTYAPPPTSPTAQPDPSPHGGPDHCGDGGLLGHLLGKDGLLAAAGLFGDSGAHDPLLDIHLQVSDPGLLDWDHAC